MNEWKELKKDNLSSDILTGNYEFRTMHVGNYYIEISDSISAIDFLYKNFCVEYRKKEKPAPTHEEIMTKWWNLGNFWMRVVSYEPHEQHPYKLSEYRDYVKKDFFINLESADIPPEGK